MISLSTERGNEAAAYLLNIDDVHNDATFEHTGEACLDSKIAGIVTAGGAVHAVTIDGGDTISGTIGAVAVGDGKFGLLRHGSWLFFDWFVRCAGRR